MSYFTVLTDVLFWQVRERNLMDIEDETFYGQKLEACTVKACFKDCMEKSGYAEKREQFNEFNRLEEFFCSVVDIKRDC